ncbi:MAG: DUF1492 domain-containing protein [Clostridiales bacterium]|nr:DUF1492 domain-containing protein [Clostridiales bacterium]
MTAKEYLGQAYRIDQRIKNKTEQLNSFRELAVNVSSTISDYPSKGTRNVYRLENTIVKIVDMENQIKADIDRLINLKIEITNAIDAVDDENCKELLRLRYLELKSWSEIADEMDYSVPQIYRIKNKALKKFVVPQKTIANDSK